MTTGDNNHDDKKRFTVRELLPMASGLSGVVALFGWLSFLAVIPERVSKLETADRDQNAEIKVLRDDSMQRREMLATAMATLSQINERTKRLEDALIK
jgi:hypothetical protein